MKGTQIVGTGSCIPDNIVKNKDLESFIDTSDEWIKSRTGIEERRISIDEGTSELAAKAAIRAVKESKLSVQDIELIIVATITPDGVMPSVACNVQKIIGADRAVAFDINAACSGFIFAIETANKFIRSGCYKNALVIGAETLSKIIDWNDRNTCVLFGDGAGAVVLAECDKEHIASINCRSIGSKGEFIKCSNMPLDNPFIEDKEEIQKIKMNGREIYKFAVKTMEEELHRILEEEKLSKEDIDFIIPHQANSRMIESFSGKAGIPMSKFILNINKVGNTSAASVAIALDEANKAGKLKKGNKIIIIAFGGGLTYGSALITWN